MGPHISMVLLDISSIKNTLSSALLSVKELGYDFMKVTWKLGTLGGIGQLGTRYQLGTQTISRARSMGRIRTS